MASEDGQLGQSIVLLSEVEVDSEVYIELEFAASASTQLSYSVLHCAVLPIPWCDSITRNPVWP